MKKLIGLITLVAAASAYSQGTIGTVNFNNVSKPLLNAPVTYGDQVAGSGAPVAIGAKPDPQAAVTYTIGQYIYGGPNAQCALYGGMAGTAEANLQILLPAAGFRSGAYAGAVDPGSVATRGIPGTYGGDPGVVQLRAWDAGELLADNTYEGAVAAAGPTHGVYYGVSKVMNISSLGGIPNIEGATPITPPNLPLGTVVIPMGAYGTFVPEPSIIGLGILGAIAGMMVFRRRN